MIYYGCPKCQGPMASPNGMVGQPETCPNCGNVTTVPAPAQQAQQPSGEAPPIQPGPGGYGQQAPAAYAQPAEPAQPGKGAWYAALGLAIPGLAIGGLALASSWATPCCCCVPVPMAGLGLVLGLVGLVMGCVARPRQVALPAAAVCVSILAIGVYVYQTGSFFGKLNQSINTGISTIAKAQKAAKIARAKGQIANLKVALKTFEIECARYPTTAEGLNALVRKPASLDEWNGPYVAGRRTLRDPWGRAFVYVCPGTHEGYDFDLYSKGPDGKAGTADDIGNWNLNDTSATQPAGPTTTRAPGPASEP